MTVIIDYATISPAVLCSLVEHAVPFSLCTYTDLNEDAFEFSVCGWLPLLSSDLAKVEEVLAQFV